MDNPADRCHDIFKMSGNSSLFHGQGNCDEKTVYDCAGKRGTGRKTAQNEGEKTQIQHEQYYNIHGRSDHGVWDVMGRRGREAASHTEGDRAGAGIREVRCGVSGKWKGRLSGDRGMTLTELIASLAIAFILMSFLIRMYTYTGNMFETSASTDDLRRTTQVIANYLEDRIACSESLVISREELTGDEYGHEILFSKDGRIYCDGEAIFEAEFYRKRKVFCEILPALSEENAPVLKYRITWKNRTNTALYSADSVVKLVNLELNGKEIIRRDLEGGAGTAGNTLYIYYTDPDYLGVR